MNIITQNAIAKLDDLAEWELLHLWNMAEEADPEDKNREFTLGNTALNFIPTTDDEDGHIDIRRVGKAVNAKIVALRSR